MRLNANRLLRAAVRTNVININRTTQVTVINDIVDSVSGTPAELTSSDLDGLDLKSIAIFLYQKFAGDGAFLVQTSGGFALVRPAFSEFPVFYREGDQQIHVWAGMRLPQELLVDFPGFDLGYLSQAMRNWSWLTPRTGLRGVSELLSGAILIFDGHKLKQHDLLADTVLQLPVSDVRDYEQEVDHLRQLILNSVAHKLGAHREQSSILCSGGIDSSVGAVAAAKLYPEKRFTLIHGFSNDCAHGDERYYLYKMAEHLNWPALEIDTSLKESKISLSPELVVPTARPVKTSAALPTMAALMGLAKRCDSKIMLSGDGGDQLFLLGDPIVYSGEILGEDPSMQAKVISANQLASMGRETIWDVLGEARHKKRSGALRERFFGQLVFPPNPLCANRQTEHYELIPNGNTLERLSTSRAFQFFGMRNAELNKVPVAGYDVEERKTFLFWPVIRAALIAKRMHHLQGGRDRALERDAFREELPGEIHTRHSKGGSLPVSERYEFEVMLESLRGSAAVKHGLIKENLIEPACGRFDENTAFAIVMARGFSDWMEQFDSV